APIKNNGTHNTATPTMTGISMLAICSPAISGTGETIPDIPSTHKILKMLLPTTLPTAISRCPLILATTEVTTSGSEVPAATMVNPITASLTPQAVAISTALCTSQRAPHTSNARPPITISIFFQTGTGSLSISSTSSSVTSAPCFLPWKNRNAV